MIIKILKKQNNGFTLVESLVAISILMVAIVTPMTIAQKGLNSATYSKDQMTASYLAQDAIEFIKNKRDEIGINRDPLSTSTPRIGEWIGKDSFFNNCFEINGCKIDTIADLNNITLFASGDKLKIIRNGDYFLYYGHNTTGEDSKFTRQIKITSPAVANGDQNEALITATVSWQNNGVEEKVIIKNFIYNYWGNL